MKHARNKNKILSGFLTFALAVMLTAGFPVVKAYAASGTVYTCAVNRCYAHPVTGEIEDSGGENSYVTGQGMVEGCVYPTGMLEVTDSGEYYLTIRMSLMDYTSGHSFWVQSVGGSGWTTPAMEQTGSGSDTNGTTADVTIQVPSENCVVRAAMYVEPMQRDVVFYFYPSDYSEGNSTDMAPSIVTESSRETEGYSEGTSSSESNPSEDSTGETSSSGSLSPDTSAIQESETTDSSVTESEASSASDMTASSDSDETENSVSGSSGIKLESSIVEAAKPTSDGSDLDAEKATLNSAEGLSLSTAQNVDDREYGSDSASYGNRIFQIALAVTVSGLILISAVAAVVYFFRKNWRRWGGAEDDEE